MSSTTKVITAQVGAKLVTIQLGMPSPIGARKVSADMFGAVGTLLKFSNGSYMLSIELRELKKVWSVNAKTIAQCTDKFFAELRYQNSLIEAAQSREEYDLNNHEHNKSDWDF
jgi:hypothetical protein